MSAFASGRDVVHKSSQFEDVTLTVDANYVATVEFYRPPENYFDSDLVTHIADAFDEVAADPAARVIVLCSKGRHFCAGATQIRSSAQAARASEIYVQAQRLFAGSTPVVAAIQGAAIGGGLGLALVADFRVGAPEARLSANFARMGYHHGFGLTVTLPLLVGQQRTLDLLYTGRRVRGEEALSIGLIDRLAPVEKVRTEAVRFAAEIAASGPLAVQSIRQTMRADLLGRIRHAIDRERTEQDRLRDTADYREGVQAMAERRMPNFEGK